MVEKSRAFLFYSFLNLKIFIIFAIQTNVNFMKTYKEYKKEINESRLKNKVDNDILKLAKELSVKHDSAMKRLKNDE